MLNSAPIKRRRKLALTPLIDVIFLLLLFFMLSSTFSRFSEVSIGGGGAGANANKGQPDAIITFSGANVLFNGEAVSVSANEIEDRVTALQENGGKAVMVIVNSEIVAQDLVPVLQSLNATGIGVVVARQGQ
ncbi:MAG: biopolymer transporter ExbD [Ahrensia sp.]|nr:biopolymer transporter ExbD [Ahrensia sp.]